MQEFDMQLFIQTASLREIGEKIIELERMYGIQEMKHVYLITTPSGIRIGYTNDFQRRKEEFYDKIIDYYISEKCWNYLAIIHDFKCHFRKSIKYGKNGEYYRCDFGEAINYIHNHNKEVG